MQLSLSVDDWRRCYEACAFKDGRLPAVTLSMSVPLRRAVLAFIGCAFWLVSHSATAGFDVTRGSYRTEERQVVAGSEGVSLKYPSGLLVELDPGSKLRQHKDTDLWMASSGKTSTELFSLVEGRARVLRPVRDDKRPIAVLVRTTRKLMGATAGGEILVIAEKDAGIIATYSGSTLLSTGGSWQKLPEGQYGKMVKGGPKITIADLPRAPKVRAERTLWMSLQAKAPIHGVSWTKTESDVRARLSVKVAGSDEEVASLVTSEAVLVANGVALGPGMYELRVQAINSYGLIGPYSEPARLRVVGVRTHRGARVDSRGTLHLAANQRAEFVNVEGLLMAYGNASRWAPATASVPLRDRDPVFVHFREADSANVVSARLEPRGVVADVYVGSKLARWPGDNVEVTVRLRDESGELGDGSIVPQFEVTLGIEPLTLKWRREGSTWRATIPPHNGPGPWVIRAAVTDEHGVELGRDFLEVAERASTKPHRNRNADPIERNNPLAHAD